MPLPTAYSHATSELWVHLHIHSCKCMLVQLVQPHTNLRASSASSCLTSPSLRYRRVLTLWPSRLSLAVEGSKYSGHSCTWTLLLYHCILILQFSYQIIVFCSYSLSQFKFKLTKLKNLPEAVASKEITNHCYVQPCYGTHKLMKLPVICEDADIYLGTLVGLIVDCMWNQTLPNFFVLVFLKLEF